MRVNARYINYTKDTSLALALSFELHNSICFLLLQVIDIEGKEKTKCSGLVVPFLVGFSCLACMYVCVCVCVHMCMCVSVWCVCVCVVCMRVCVWVVCVCVCICVCVSLG